jgi:hypothetical protein
VTHSPTLHVSHPWSLHADPGSITWHSLGGKSCFSTQTGTQDSMLPATTIPATFTLKSHGKWGPYISRTQGFCCSMNNRKCKPAGLIPLCWQQLMYHTPRSLCKQPGPRFPLPTGLDPSTAAMAPGNPGQQAGPRVPTAWRLGSPIPAAAAMAFEAHAPTQVDWDSTTLWTPGDWSLLICCLTGTPNLLLSARSLLLHTQVNHSLHMLFCWCQLASLPMEKEAQH